MSEPDTHVILAKRRGLMKLALRTGAAIVPMYVFGGTNFFKQLATDGGMLGSVSRLIKGGFTFFWGQYGLPIPFKCKCSMVMADPIKVDKVEGEPTPEQVTSIPF